jgi:hypothetical protein
MDLDLECRDRDSAALRRLGHRQALQFDQGDRRLLGCREPAQQRPQVTLHRQFIPNRGQCSFRHVVQRLVQRLAPAADLDQHLPISGLVTGLGTGPQRLQQRLEIRPRRHLRANRLPQVTHRQRPTHCLQGEVRRTAGAPPEDFPMNGMVTPPTAVGIGLKPMHVQEILGAGSSSKFGWPPPTACRPRG